MLHSLLLIWLVGFAPHAPADRDDGHVDRLVALADEYILALPPDQARLREEFESHWINEPFAFRAILHRLARDERPFSSDDPRVVLFGLLRDGARVRRTWDARAWSLVERAIDADLSHLIARFSQSNRQLPLIVDMKLEFDSFTIGDAPYLTRTYLQRYQANLLVSWLRVMSDPTPTAREELMRRLDKPEGRPPLIAYALAYRVGARDDRRVLANLFTRYGGEVLGVDLNSARKGYRLLADESDAVRADYRRAANELLAYVFGDLGRRLRAGDDVVRKTTADLSRRGPMGTRWTADQERAFGVLLRTLRNGGWVDGLIDVASPDCALALGTAPTSRGT